MFSAGRSEKVREKEESGNVNRRNEITRCCLLWKCVCVECRFKVSDSSVNQGVSNTIKQRKGWNIDQEKKKRKHQPLS